MANLWTRGGLSWGQLLMRTWRAAWGDAVFGQGARLAFYHFLAIFPGLLLLFTVFTKLAINGSSFANTLLQAFDEILPHAAAELMHTMVGELRKASGTEPGTVSAAAGAAWAAVNATWAVMVGLNTAYEVKEERPLWKVLSLAFALTAALAMMFVICVAAALYGTRVISIATERLGLQGASVFLVKGIIWAPIIALLLVSFGLYYRFGPNLSDREWQWSTPGAALALALWITATLLLRFYFEHFHSYSLIYKQINGVAVLLLWLYFTSAAILIGGEMNSEIEKAAKEKDGSAPGGHRAREGR